MLMDSNAWTNKHPFDETKLMDEGNKGDGRMLGRIWNHFSFHRFQSSETIASGTTNFWKFSFTEAKPFRIARISIEVTELQHEIRSQSTGAIT